MKNLTKKLAIVAVCSSLAFAPISRTWAAEKDDEAVKAEVERRVNEELQKRQKSQSPGSLLANIYDLYSENLIGQSKNLKEAQENRVHTINATATGTMVGVFGGVIYIAGKSGRDTGVKNVGKAVALVGVPLAIWGINRQINDAALLKTNDSLVRARVTREFFKRFSRPGDEKKWMELKRDITAGWNLDKLLKKYGDEEQAIIFANFYEKARTEAGELLKDISMESSNKDSLIAEIAAERAIRRYLSLEADPETQKDIQKWLDLNTESIKETTRKVAAVQTPTTAHSAKAGAAASAETHN